MTLDQEFPEDETWKLSFDDEWRREALRNDRGRMAWTMTCRGANNEDGPVFYHRNHLRISSSADLVLRSPPLATNLATFPGPPPCGLNTMPEWFVKETSRDRLEAIRTLTEYIG